MFSPLKSFLLTPALLALAASTPEVQGKQLFVSDTGSGDALSASAPGDIAFFNAARNWGSGPGQISPGDTVHLVGTITHALLVQASGRPGKAITILFDPGASMQSPVWSARTGAINVDSKDFITIDGGATGTIGGPKGDPKLVNGFIENTANGTGLAHQSTSIFIYAPDSSNLTVKNLGLYNLYVRTSLTDEAPAEGAIRDRCAINSFYNGGPARKNVVVTNCIIHDAYAGILVAYGEGTENFEYSYCTVYNCNWGGACGDGNKSAAMTGLSVHDNYIHDFGNWDDAPVDNFHHDGFFAWAVSGGHLTTVRFYNNVLGPNFGLEPASGAFFIEGLVADVAAFNNVFVENRGDHPADGLIYLAPYYNIVATYAILNNTFVGGGSGVAINFGPTRPPSSPQTILIKNNLISSVGTAIVLCTMNPNITAMIDYNLVYNLGPDAEYSYSDSGVARFKSASKWRDLGFDAHGLNQDPILDSDNLPQPQSPAVSAGADLSLLGYFTSDIDGKPRPQGSPWDIGAHQVAGHP